MLVKAFFSSFSVGYQFMNTSAAEDRGRKINRHMKHVENLQASHHWTKQININFPCNMLMKN